MDVQAVTTPLEKEFAEEIYYLIHNVRDPEKPYCTLAQLNIVAEEGVSYHEASKHHIETIRIYLQPTTPKCHLMQQIGLAIYSRLRRELPQFHSYKVRIECKEGSHNDHLGVNKLLNDKERMVAALQTEPIRQFIDSLVLYE